MTKVSGANVIDGASSGSTRRGTPFSTTKIYGRWPRAAAKGSAAPEASSVIVKGDQYLTENRYGTRAPAKERRSVLSKRTLQGAWKRGLSEAAPVPKSGAVRDVSGARPNWAAIDAFPREDKVEVPS